MESPNFADSEIETPVKREENLSILAVRTNEGNESRLTTVYKRRTRRLPGKETGCERDCLSHRVE